MAYTVTDLITRAFYLSQVISRELQTVSGPQLEDGLTWLNALLSLKSAYSRVIPYYSQYVFNAVPNQEEYFVPNLVQPETLTFNIGPVRYSTLPASRRPYFGSGRVDNISSLPFNWHFERALGGSNIFLYFLPSDAFVIKIWGKFGFTNVTLNQDLELLYDEYYIDYLRYRLAQRICSEYGIPLQPQAVEELRELEEAVTDVSPPDVTLTKITTLTGESGINWGDINLGKGWRPGN
jgi:hypothetical protein